MEVEEELFQPFGASGWCHTTPTSSTHHLIVGLASLFYRAFFPLSIELFFRLQSEHPQHYKFSSLQQAQELEELA